MSKPNLPEEKKKAVLAVAIREFAEKGYGKASTNKIIQGAEISKGLLFHYFGNKKNLYLYALDVCIEKYLLYFEEYMGKLSTDFLERLLEISTVKVKMFMENPIMYRMIASGFVDVTQEIKAEVLSRQQKLSSEYVPLFLNGIDRSLFRDEISQDAAIELIMIAMEALSQKHIGMYREKEDRGLKDLPGITEELRGYIEMLKYGVYKTNEGKRG